jgi:RimJ/RimL family protein N-acetyltransferase
MEALALEYAFFTLKLHKLQCEVLAFNELVIKLHKKFGFIVEGTLREQHKIDGEYGDIYRLGLLKAEWEEKRKDMLNKLLNMVKR